MRRRTGQGTDGDQGASCIGEASIGEAEAVGLLSSPRELLPPLAPKKAIDPTGEAAAWDVKPPGIPCMYCPILPW
ncbi:unnamed protein product [Urochloa humidicola]